MSLYYFTKRNSLFGRVCSYVLTFVLVLSMALGCVVLPQRVSTSVKAATTAKYRNVMYYGDWSIYSGQKNFTPDKIDGSLITHLNFAFMDADANGDLITTDTWQIIRIQTLDTQLEAITSTQVYWEQWYS